MQPRHVTAGTTARQQDAGTSDSPAPSAPSLQDHTIAPSPLDNSFARALDLLNPGPLRASILDATQSFRRNEDVLTTDAIQRAVAHISRLSEGVCRELLREFFSNKSDSLDPCPHINRTVTVTSPAIGRASLTCRSILETGVISPLDTINGTQLMMQRLAEKQISGRTVLLSWIGMGTVIGSWIAAPGPIAIGCTVVAGLASQQFASSWRFQEAVAAGYAMESAHMLKMLHTGEHNTLREVLNELFWESEDRDQDGQSYGQMSGFILARSLRVLGSSPEDIFEGICNPCPINRPWHPLVQSLREKLEEHEVRFSPNFELPFNPKTPLSAEYSSTRELIEVLDKVYFLSALRQRDMCRSTFAGQVLEATLVTGDFKPGAEGP